MRSFRVLVIALFLPALGLSCRDATGPDQMRLYTHEQIRLDPGLIN